MMFLCSVASELSVGAFVRINTVVILLGDVIRDNPWVVQQKWRGVRFQSSLWEPEVGIKSSRIFH